MLNKSMNLIKGTRASKGNLLFKLEFPKKFQPHISKIMPARPKKNTDSDMAMGFEYHYSKSAQFEADSTLKFTYFWTMTQKSTAHRFNYKSNFIS